MRSLLQLYLVVISFLLVCSANIYAQITPLPNRSLQMTSSVVSASGVRYSFNFNVPAAPNVQSIEFEFCDNNPFPGQFCDESSNYGFDTRHDNDLTIINQTGETGFSIHPTSSNENRIVLTRPASPTVSQPVGYEFENIINSSVAGTHYVRVGIYSSNDATGTRVAEGGIAYSLNERITLSSEVPPYLIFCTSTRFSGNDCNSGEGNYINFGILKSDNTSYSQSEMIVGTNAESGYTISVHGTTLTSGNNTIANLSSRQTSLKGISQYGMNLRANSSPTVGAEPSGPGAGSPSAEYSVANQYKFVPGDTIATHNYTSDYRKFTASHVVNVAAGQAPGRYAATITYICLATY